MEAAAEAGVEVRTGFVVDDLLHADGRVVGVHGHAAGRRRQVEERAALVVGADGRHSTVARGVAAPTSRTHPPFSVGYYAYWSGLPVGWLDLHLLPRRAVMAFDTHDDLACVVVAAAHADLPELSRDLESGYLHTLRMVQRYAEAVGSARRESRITGMAMPSFWRRAWGPGWALVGDARCDRDPCTAQGITSAFLDAEALATEWLHVVGGDDPEDVALARFEHVREVQTLPMYDLTCELATLEPPPPEREQLLATVAQDEGASQRFVSMIAGTVSVPEFFAGVGPAVGAPSAR